MLIQQAAYGPLNGHSFLAGSTPAMEAMFRDAAFITDLQQSIPAGIQWTPFYRLVSHDRWLLLMHTRAAEAGARAGMVRSRAAFIPKDTLTQIPNLEPIAHALSLSQEPGATLQAIEVHEASSLTSELHGPTPLEVGIANALLRVPSKAWPLVVAEEVDIAQAIFGLWRRVPPDFRHLLTFGLGFEPEGLNGLAVVRTPPAFAGRWDSTRIVEIDSSEAPSAKVEILLSDHDDSGVRTFASEWGLTLDSPAAIDLVHRVHARWQTRKDFSDDIYLLRILLEKARSNSSTRQKIAEILQFLESSCATWSTDVVLSVRNIDFGGLAESAKFQDAFRLRLRSQILTGNSSDVYSILVSWHSGNARAWWIQAADLSLKNSFQAEDPPSAAMLSSLWELCQKKPESVKGILTALGSHLPHIEPGLLAVKKGVIGTELATTLFGQLVQCGCLQLAGQVLSNAMTSTDCLRTVLSAGTGLSTEAKNVLFESSLITVDSELGALAALLVYIETGDRLLLALATSKAVAGPEVFRNFNWRVLAWFELLAEVAPLAPTAEEFIPNGLEGVEVVVAERLTTVEIWLAISKSKFSNLANVHSRSQAWGLMPASVLPQILNATAKGWLKSFEDGIKLPAELEEPLKAAVFACVAHRGYMVDVVIKRPMVAAHYLGNFGLQNEVTAVQLVDDLRFGPAISRVSAEAIGRHFFVNGYRSASKSAGLEILTRSDFAPLIKECFGLLGKLNRLWIGPILRISPGLTYEECWEAFEAEACNIYQLGPFDRAIWARSGGREDALVRDGPGREQWHRCMKALRDGMDPGVEALLREMHAEFRQNGVFPELLKSRFWF